MLRGVGATFLLVGALVAIPVVDGWAAFGKAPAGDRLERMESSPWHANGVFENPQPLWNDDWGAAKAMFSANEHGRPTVTPPFVAIDARRFQLAPESGLRVTWLGHSTLLVEIEGRRFLTDPVWGRRCSPVTWLGPERWYEPPLPLTDVPKLDAVVISHDHYDHLDHETILSMKDWDTTFIAPLGVGAHLVYWGVPEARIVELDWWEKRSVGGVDVVSIPARHASGRHLLDQNRTLWSGYAFVGKRRRAFFSGDTGMFPGIGEIGSRLGPFDVTMIEVGAYGHAWPDWHLGPEQAVRAHVLVRGEVFLPIHWGLFNLAFHGWTEPIERVLVAAKGAGVRVAAPRPGESVEPARPPPIEPWWPELPWRTADEYPIVSTKLR